ncbi:MAG: DAK2 domain-containing protein [Actinomycetes bacterium]
MRVHEALDAEGVRLWAESALAALGLVRAEIDAINVYPVADADTGTNLYLTLEAGTESVARALSESAEGKDGLDSLAIAAAALSRGTLLGARGNSGVILSQYLRGAVDVFAEGVSLRTVPPGRVLASALERAAALAYAAVARPVEGTMLSVGNAAAAAARIAAAADPSALGAVARAAADGAAEALARTPSQLAVLERSGVVDAGGRGLVVLLETLADVLGGVRHVGQSLGAQRSALAGARSVTIPRIPAAEFEYHGPAFEVMYLLEADPEPAAELRERLAHLGESVVVVGADQLWNVHVHADDAGAAIEAGIESGRPFRIRVTALTVVASDDRRVVALKPTRRLVVVTHGPGTAELFEAAGALVVPAQPQGRPSSAELLVAIKGAESAEVVVLPSDAGARAAAEAAAAQAREFGIRTAVLPIRSIVQSLAAAAVHVSGATFDEDVVAMTNAASATRYAAITIADREVLTSAGVCRPGDVMGLVEGDVVEIGSVVADVAVAVIERLLAGAGELVTLLAGVDGNDELMRTVAAAVRARHPGVEVSQYYGGQPLWPLIIGVE